MPDPGDPAKPDRAYLSVLPKDGQGDLTQDEVQALVNVLGVDVMAEFSSDGGLLLGFSWERFPDRSIARRNLETALLTNFGENWNERFQVQDS